MSSPPPPQYDDPMADVTRQLAHGLGILATVGEAAARFAVVGAQRRTARLQTQTRLETQANRLDAAATDAAFDQQWLGNAGLADVAALWRTAALHAANGDARARDALRRAEARLRQLHPPLMLTYGQHRNQGLSLAEAMRQATHDIARQETRRARPLGGRPQPVAAIAAAPDPHGQTLLTELEAHIREQITALGTGIDPDQVDTLIRRARAAGRVPAAEAASRLAEAARQLRADAHTNGTITGTAHIRVGVNSPTDPQQPPAAITASTQDTPVVTADVGKLLTADALDAAAATIDRAARDRADHLHGLAGQERRSGTVESGQPDNPATAVNEHNQGVAVGAAQRRTAEQDDTTAAQQERLGRAFPPLTGSKPTQPARNTPPTQTPARGRTR